MTTPLPDLAQFLLEAAKRAGADSADVLVVRETNQTITVTDRALEKADRAEGLKIGLRAILGTKQACVAASDSSESTIAEMAERAVAMASVAPDDASVGLADPGILATDTNADFLEHRDPAGEPGAAALEAEARAAEAAALEVEGVSQVSEATAAFDQIEIEIAATNGFSGGYTRTENALFCVAITGSGTEMERDYDGEVRNYRADLRSAEDIGVKAAERAVARAGARKPPTGAYPVLYDERVSSSLVGHILQAINGNGDCAGIVVAARCARHRHSSGEPFHCRRTAPPESIRITLVRCRGSANQAAYACREWAPHRLDPRPLDGPATVDGVDSKRTPRGQCPSATGRDQCSAHAIGKEP